MITKLRFNYLGVSTALVLALVFSTLLMVVTASANHASAEATNPELSVVYRYAHIVADKAELDILANNPEVRLVRRFEKAAAQTINPELMVADRDIDIAVKTSAESSYATNPELSVAQRHTAVGVELEEENVLRTWEIGSDDIAAAREAALSLSQINAASEVDFDAAELLSGELDAFDISAARQAAQILNRIIVAGGVDLKNPAFPRTAAELELARRYGASEEHLALLSAE